jgi:hypothetical protein
MSHHKAGPQQAGPLAHVRKNILLAGRHERNGVINTILIIVNNVKL